MTNRLIFFALHYNFLFRKVHNNNQWANVKVQVSDTEILNYNY